MLFRIYAVLLALSVALPVFSSQIVIGGQVDVPAAGVRMRLFNNLKSFPLPMPDNSNEQDKWHFAQTAGCWHSGSCAIQTAVLTAMPPASGGDGDVPVKETDIAAWLSRYTGCEIKKVNIFKKNAAKIIRSADFSGSDPLIQDLIYVVSPANVPERMFMLRILVDKKQYDARLQRVIEQILSSITFYPVKSPNGKKSSGNRETAIAGIASLKGWWHMDSPHFLFITNYTNRNFVRSMIGNMEKAYAVYSALFPGFSDKESTCVVRLYAKREEFLAANPGQEWAAGYWNAARRELVLSPQWRRTGGDDRREMLGTALHEGLHQYLFYALDGINAPVWFNEGFAQLCEGIDCGAARPVIKLKETDRKNLCDVFRNSDFDALSYIKMNVAEFQSGGAESLKRHYAEVFGLIYYLLCGSRVDGHPEYAEIPEVFFNTLRRTRSAGEATAAAFGNVDFARLSAAVSDFWRNDRLVEKSLKINPAEKSPVK